MPPAAPPTRHETALDERAEEAERSVSALFTGHLAGLASAPLARVTHPPPVRTIGGLRGEWHYWWQAHYLDAVVDAGARAARTGDPSEARRQARRGGRLLAAIRVRNAGRWSNDFYDDMAWLALASGRLAALHAQLGVRGPRHLMRSAQRVLTAQLRSAHTDDLGGGLFWSRDRTVKNAPATGPAALHLARVGDAAAAHRLVDWVYARLWSPQSGLVLDGIRLESGKEVSVPDVWSYNQGTVLGALLALGDAESLARAAALVHAVDERLTRDVGGDRVLLTHGAGDGGLFTGILARYLALAAAAELPGDAAATARRLVHDTAEALWQGRGDRRSAGRRAATVFPAAPGGAPPTSPAVPLELSPQLQAWTVLEAAAAVS